MNFKPTVKLIALASLVLLSACASQSNEWGNYSNQLYAYYKTPTDAQRLQLTDELQKIFARAELKGKAPPPGLFAEYGTIMLEQGDQHSAVEYYIKERDAWPESRVLMESLIQTLQQKPHNANTTES